MTEGKFGTAINCMDGRVQEPVINWLKVRFGLDYVDMITEPGPIKALAENDTATVTSIAKRVAVSVEKHNSTVIAVVGHHDCAGNPVPKEQQIEQIRKSLDVLKSWRTGIKLVGLYVTDSWLVTLVDEMQ
jgi:carbonic anhydrase